jgi:DNA-binding transcriptional MerR regulator
MTPKLFRAAEVCDIAQVQPYVLRSWEKEFPGIGVQKSDESPRLYRQSDVDQVLLIKRLVFSEGLTLAGARRKLEEAAPRTPAVVDHEVAEVLDALASDARTRIAYVRDGLRSILRLLSNAPGSTVVVVDDQHATNGNGAHPRSSLAAAVRPMPQRSKADAPARAARPAVGAKPTRPAPKPSSAGRPSKSFAAGKPATMKASAAAKTAGKSKRSRASA